MIKRGASRNPRSKGIKVKHILQICLLFAVCFWLIYQLKRAHDTKRELDDNISKFVKSRNSDESLKFGRKDLHPYKHEAIKNDKTEDNDEEVMNAAKVISKDEEDEQEKDEDEQTKLEDQVKQEESKYEEDQDEDKSQETDGKSEDDEVDENDKENIEEQTDQDEDLVEEEKERAEEGEEQLTETNEVEGKDDEVDHETLPEDQDPDIDNQNARGAREENYKADDASSAVSHVTQYISTTSETINSEDKDKNFARQNLEHNNGSSNNRSGIVDGVKTNLTEHLRQGKMAEDDPSADLKTGEKDDETVVGKNTTSTSLSNDQAITSNQSTQSSTEVKDNWKGWSTEGSNLALLNESQVQNPTLDSAIREVSKVQVSEAALLDNKKISDSSQSVGLGETTNTSSTVSSNSSSSSESTKAGQTLKTESAAEVGSKNTTEASHVENSDMNYESEETNIGTDSAANDIEEAIQRDPIDASDSAIDLSTLAADNREVVGRKDAAGE